MIKVSTLFYIIILLIRDTKAKDQEIKNNNMNLQPVAGPMITKDASNITVVNQRGETNYK